MLRSKSYRVLLVLAAAIGVVATVAAWGSLNSWGVPVLPVAGVIIASRSFAAGHLGPSAGRGVKAGAPTKPIELPGIVLAALASVGLGLVLSPEEGWCSVRRLR